MPRPLGVVSVFDGARFEGRFEQRELPYGLVVTWDALVGAGRGFSLGLGSDLDEQRIVAVVPSEREGLDGSITDVWVTSQPGSPVHDTLWEAVKAAVAHLRSGFPATDTSAFIDLLSAILTHDGVGPNTGNRRTVKRAFLKRFVPGVWADVDYPSWVTPDDLVALYRLAWTVDPAFQVTEFRTKPLPAGFVVDLRASNPERRAALGLVVDDWLDRMDERRG